MSNVDNANSPQEPALGSREAMEAEVARGTEELEDNALAHVRGIVTDPWKADMLLQTYGAIRKLEAARQANFSAYPELDRPMAHRLLVEDTAFRVIGGVLAGLDNEVPTDQATRPLDEAEAAVAQGTRQLEVDARHLIRSMIVHPQQADALLQAYGALRSLERAREVNLRARPDFDRPLAHKLLVEGTAFRVIGRVLGELPQR